MEFSRRLNIVARPRNCNQRNEIIYAVKSLIRFNTEEFGINVAD